MQCFFGPAVDQTGRLEAWVLSGHLQDLANCLCRLYFDRIAWMVMALGGLDAVTDSNGRSRTEGMNLRLSTRASSESSAILLLQLAVVVVVRVNQHFLTTLGQSVVCRHLLGDGRKIFHLKS